MKLSDFNNKSNKNPFRPKEKFGRSPEISFVNETQIKGYEDKISKLSEDNSKMQAILEELNTAKHNAKKQLPLKAKPKKS